MFFQSIVKKMLYGGLAFAKMYRPRSAIAVRAGWPGRNFSLLSIFLYTSIHEPCYQNRMFHKGKSRIYNHVMASLNLSQTTNFRLFQTERTCRRQF